jgi:PAS domain S-box-containing protein
MPQKNRLINKYRNIFLIFISLASLMISSAVFEIYQSKKELYRLMQEQSHSLLESLIVASQNTLFTNDYLEDLWEKRLLNNGNLIKKLFDSGIINNAILQEISRENDIFRINIFNRQGKKIYSSHQREHTDLIERHSPQQYLQPIFSGATDTLILGLKKARFEEGFRFAVALATSERGAIVLNIDARQLLDFKRHIGFGALLRNVVSDNAGIVYAALQDTTSILAASGNVKVLEAVDRSEFLTRSLKDSLFLTRSMNFDSLEVFEAVHPFSYQSKTIGVLRLGLSMDPVQEINQRIYRRLVIITIILVVIGSFMFIFIFTRQRYDLLQKQYQVVETYSGNIIDNVSDAIIVFNQLDGIKIFNHAAEKIFNTSKNEQIGNSPFILLKNSGCEDILDNISGIQQINSRIGGVIKFLIVSKNHFIDSKDIENIILVVRDLTDQKRLEEQIERKNRLTAMGELASGVAHEIRNPLNTIGTIIQQLNKDFEPKKEKKEYHALATLVSSEVKRINDTVQDFLRFARPEPIQPRSFKISTLFEQLLKQFSFLLKEHQIEFNIQIDWKGSVFWDENQIRQVLINIIQNASEAIKNKGKIDIHVTSENNQLIAIRIKDNGPGMSEKIRANIFNLYFTTKAKGTGIGLSIVQRIIYEHEGIITVNSTPGKGTTFYIQLPRKFQITGSN